MENNIDFTIDKNIKDTEKRKSSLLVKKKDIQEKIKGKLSNRFTSSEIISLLHLQKYDKVLEEEFYLKDYLEINKKLKENPKIKLTVSIYDINFIDRTIRIKGADTYLNFIVSKFDMETLKYFLDNNYESVLAEVIIRKHKEDTLFIEKVTPLIINDEEIYNLLLELRNQLTTVEWKNLLLHSLGYNLSDSKSILKDLMLVRAIPYVEKNYSYIELGPYSTGKTSFSENFTVAEKISTDISMAQLYYNVKEKKDGILFYKDVLYLDEADFSDLEPEVARVLLQVLSGNKINVRDNSISKQTDVSIVYQGNVVKGLEKYIEGEIFDKFKKSFNPGAFFDRTNFFIAGWLIPIYEKIKLEEEQEVIPVTILERIFKILRENEIYNKFINENYEIVLIADNYSQGRFIKSIKSTISGFLKLLYLGQEINPSIEDEELKKIITLSILGKYSIYYQVQKKPEDRVEVYYKGKKEIVVNIKNLFLDYIQSIEEKYFENNIINMVDDTNQSSEENNILWENDGKESLIVKRIIRQGKKEKITSFPKIYEKLLDKLEDYEIKEKFKEYYRIIVTFNMNDYINESYSSEVAKDFEEYFIAVYILFRSLLEISRYKILMEEEEFIKKFLNYLLEMDFINVQKIKLNKKDSKEIEIVFYEEMRYCLKNDKYLNKNYKIEAIIINEEIMLIGRFKNIIIRSLKNIMEKIERNFNAPIEKAVLNKTNIIKYIKDITVPAYMISERDKIILKKIEPQNKTLHEKFMSI